MSSPNTESPRNTREGKGVFRIFERFWQEVKKLEILTSGLTQAKTLSKISVLAKLFWFKGFLPASVYIILSFRKIYIFMNDKVFIYPFSYILSEKIYVFSNSTRRSQTLSNLSVTSETPWIQPANSDSILKFYIFYPRIHVWSFSSNFTIKFRVRFKRNISKNSNWPSYRHGATRRLGQRIF